MLIFPFIFRASNKIHFYFVLFYIQSKEIKDNKIIIKHYSCFVVVSLFKMCVLIFPFVFRPWKTAQWFALSTTPHPLGRHHRWCQCCVGFVYWFDCSNCQEKRVFKSLSTGISQILSWNGIICHLSFFVILTLFFLCISPVMLSQAAASIQWLNSMKRSTAQCKNQTHSRILQETTLITTQKGPSMTFQHDMYVMFYSEILSFSVFFCNWYYQFRCGKTLFDLFICWFVSFFSTRPVKYTVWW